ncbi:Endomembrane protein 70-domain-containing protein [Circinella umbellata]|nr:Endomembrane protein 70-domain-containing protein [Circinella umbellata]
MEHDNNICGIDADDYENCYNYDGYSYYDPVEVFAVLGFLSPSNRGSLATVMVIFFMVFGCISGFVSARIYKMNGGEAWKANVVLTAVFFPGIWFHRIYYGIGFLFLAFGVLLLTCSQVTILMCYHWSWRAFLTAGACGAYVFLYSILYYLIKVNINSFTSTVLYFDYSAIISIVLTVLTVKQ